LLSSLAARHLDSTDRRTGTFTPIAMPFLPADPVPNPEDIEAMLGATVLEFGTTWCSYCQAARGDIDAALGDMKPALRHIQIEDGKGRPLGRGFGVKLWPTLVVLHNGAEVARVVRPASAQAVRDALASLHRPAEASGSSHIAGDVSAGNA
jgi:thioredoxin 1